MRQIGQCDHTTLIGFIHDKRRYKSLLSCPQLTYSIIHYRPRSITYITNIITIYLKADWEGGVCTLIHNHMINHSLYPEFQSSYRQNHSMETALVKVTNDIVMKMNSQEMTLLVYLISAPLLIQSITTSCWHVWMRRLGYADHLPWNGSSHTWPTEDCESPSTNPSQSTLVWTVVFHKGYIWDPFYSSSMHPNYLRWLKISFMHCYTGDTQIYLSFRPNSSTSQEDAIRVMECCIEKISRWLIQEGHPGKTPC